MAGTPTLFTSSSSDFSLFNEQSGVRKQRYHDERYFSVVDIVRILSRSNNPRRYRSDLKIKLADEGGYSELYEKIVQLKLPSTDGKKYLSDATNTATALRIIQSIPSPNAEPLKRRLASLGNERIEEITNPEL
ncbi:hypothetical protein FACS189428_2530 [Clostridia bacterium]|nr:hypothetical protein FACS189428_2530 [Clostridia bacterium]